MPTAHFYITLQYKAVGTGDRTGMGTGHRNGLSIKLLGCVVHHASELWIEWGSMMYRVLVHGKFSSAWSVEELHFIAIRARIGLQHVYIDLLATGAPSTQRRGVRGRAVYSCMAVTCARLELVCTLHIRNYRAQLAVYCQQVRCDVSCIAG